MNESEPVGTIRALWRFPVKSMAGEELEAVDLGEGGVRGDRALAGALFPCAGVYAVAEATGTIRLDDQVSLV